MHVTFYQRYTRNIEQKFLISRKQCHGTSNIKGMGVAALINIVLSFQSSPRHEGANFRTFVIEA